MSIAEKLTTIAENEKKVYDAGKAVGVQEGMQAEYDRFWDSYQNNGNRNNYLQAFAGICWDKEISNMKYNIEIGEGYYNCREMFRYFGREQPGDELYDFTELSKKIDFSGATHTLGVFKNAKITNISVDFSNSTDLSDCFGTGDGGIIRKILSLKVTEKCTKFTNAFYYQTQLNTLIFTEDSVIAASGLDLARSTKLSKESILSIFNALSTTATGKSAKISLTAVNNAFETSEGLADGSTSDEWNALVASRSNWTISLADT